MEELSESVEVSNEFSGEITYQAEYELTEIPKLSDRYKNVLENTATSARILIDGEQVATVGMTPMEAIVAGENLNEKGVIEVAVANTAANEIVSKVDLIAMNPQTTLGTVNWHERSLQFEKRCTNHKVWKNENMQIKIKSNGVKRYEHSRKGRHE